MIRALAISVLSMYCSCTPWSVRAKCEVMYKTDYSDYGGPEQKCGVCAEVTILRGGDE